MQATFSDLQTEWAPSGLEKIVYTSPTDGLNDWALALPAPSDTWVVCIHGHGSGGDQLYTRKDIRTLWLPAFRERGLGILTPHLRGNAWMGPAAATDLRQLLGIIAGRYAVRKFIFASGSMGGTSNLIYASLFPEDVAGVIARGAATDLATYHSWCCAHGSGRPVLGEIAAAIEAAYGASPSGNPAVYREHSARLHASCLTMPIFLAHGAQDRTIPVSEARALVGQMADADNLCYVEVPNGNHDSPLYLCEPVHPLDWVLERL